MVWEWVIAAIGFVLVVAAIGTAVYRAATEELTPPVLEFAVKSVRQTHHGYLVGFTVRNSGNQTAAGLMVSGELRNGEQIVETSTARFTYAPSNSTREGGLYFSNDPASFVLNIKALGYEKP